MLNRHIHMYKQGLNHLVTDMCRQATHVSSSRIMRFEIRSQAEVFVSQIGSTSAIGGVDLEIVTTNTVKRQ